MSQHLELLPAVERMVKESNLSASQIAKDLHIRKQVALDLVREIKNQPKNMGMVRNKYGQKGKIKLGKKYKEPSKPLLFEKGKKHFQFIKNYILKYRKNAKTKKHKSVTNYMNYYVIESLNRAPIYPQLYGDDGTYIIFIGWNNEFERQRIVNDSKYSDYFKTNADPNNDDIVIRSLTKQEITSMGYFETNR